MSALDMGSNGQHIGGDSGPGIKCCVCLDEVDYRGTALIQCGRCKIEVHVKCYGVSVPTTESTWLCEPCAYMEAPAALSESAPKMQPNCIVCPTAGGALRRTSQAGVWCHVLCMNWIPELSHSLAGEMNEVLDIRVLDRSRQSLKCHICGLKGGCIQCISGRCAKPFHVICAMRVPSDTVFTGYNNENQQVYHCKTHLSDIATFKYEMIDTSWKTSPLMIKFLESTPQVKNRCRVCSAKVPPHHFGRHEILCLVGWLAKEEARIRKKKREELGLAPAVIDYGQEPAEKASGRSDNNTPGKNRKNAPTMRPCPQCGEHVRETLMMGHMKNHCKMTRHSAKRAKNPAATNRQHSSNGPATVDLTSDEPAAPAMDLSDVLFATWPGQAAGSLLDSTSFWRILNNNFFSTKILLRKRMEPLCKNLCGARLEDMGDFSKKTSAHDSIMCSETVLFGREDDAAETLSLTSIIHRCDFMMRGSRMRCVDDLFAKPMARLRHSGNHTSDSKASNGLEHEQVKEEEDARTVLVQFTNTEGDFVSCKYGFRVNDSGVSNGTEEVWSRYHPDGVSTIVGAELESAKAKLAADGKLWISLQEMQELSSSTDGVERDELTPEVSLLVERLREQMRQNRFRVRSLCRRTQAQDYHEEAVTRERVVVENYFKEYALWKALCKSLLVGYREFWKPTPVDEAGTIEDKDTKGDIEEDEEPVDDGTCVVCFDGLSPESNPIIFCDRCDLAVHQRCYGIPHVPSNEFYCDRCRLGHDGRDPATEVYCQLCPLRDGAFKKTVDGKWVHVVCALWCPGVWIGNLQTLSDIKLVDSAHRTRFVDTIHEVEALIGPPSQDASVAKRLVRKKSIDHGSLCRYCRVACGRTIKCCHSECNESFHPLCAWFEGNPMTVKLDPTSGYVYSGGGSGLLFTMFCGDHLPDNYTPELRVAQGKNRRRFRIDSFFLSQSKLQPVPVRSIGGTAARTAHVKDSGADLASVEKWTDRELCAACFDYPAPVSQDIQDYSQLNKRQLMLRCQYCNVFIHAACCLSEIDEVADLFRSNWICEHCTLVGQAKKVSAAGCVVCDGAGDYMMPCVGTGATKNPTANSVASYKTTAIASMKPPAHVQNGVVASQASELVSNGSGSEGWIHVLCAKMTKTKIFKRHHMLCATQSQLSTESHARCDICQARGRNLASCGTCSKKVHPTCAARKKFYVSRLAKSDWKFYCPTHPPVDVVYDEKRQAWFTGEVLAHLQELRHILERGRMIVEMARQRDRQKKRLLNFCSVKKMELSMEMILKKRPTPVMKDIFEQYTGETMEDVAKRQTAAPSRGAKKSKSRARSHEGDEDEETDVRRSSRRSSKAEDEPEETPLKRRRVGDDVEVTPSRRSSRRGAEGGVDDNDPLASHSNARGARASSRPRHAVTNEARHPTSILPSRRRNRALDLTPDFDYNTLSDKLLRATRDADFDDFVADAYPELI